MNSPLRPQDILVMLKVLFRRQSAWRHIDLAYELKLSPAEVGNSLERLKGAGLLDESKKKVRRMAAEELIIHGLKYFYPVQLGSLVRGMPTAHSAPPLDKMLVNEESNTLVWPSADGSMRGSAIEPLYPSAPEASKNDPQLYVFLALIDALRVGKAREQNLAIKELKKRFASYDDKNSPNAEIP